jgi:hydroxyacylglutathione hydrolase
MSETVYEVFQLSEDSWRIENGGVRMFLFEGREKALLVDTGFGQGDLKATVEGITQMPVMLVNTHTDGDHIGCNGQFEKAYMHPAEYAHYYGQGAQSAEAQPLREGEVIDLGGRRFDVLLIPGHTTGSVALLDRENRLLISGDSISEAPIFMFGQFRNIRAYIDSLSRLETLGGCFDTVYPSHGPFPVGKDIIPKLLTAAYAVMNGEAEGLAPPFEIPAKMYMTGGVGFFY